MAYLKVCGVELPLVDGERQVYRAGEVAYASNGALQNSVRLTRYPVQATTGMRPQAEAWALRGLVEGWGHSIPLDVDTYTSRCLGTLYAGGSLQASPGKYGAGFFRTAANDSIQWRMGLGTSWTVLHWQRLTGNPTWTHYTTLSSGGVVKRWANGVRNDAAPSMADVVAGELRLGDFLGLGYRDFDDVVALPFAVPEAWVPLLYAFHNTRAWPALPRVYAEGAAWPDGPRLAQGEADAGRPLYTYPGGVATMLESFSFLLREEGSP